MNFKLSIINNNTGYIGYIEEDSGTVVQGNIGYSIEYNIGYTEGIGRWGG